MNSFSSTQKDNKGTADPEGTTTNAEILNFSIAYIIKSKQCKKTNKCESTIWDSKTETIPL